jgi:hypothetical protein
MGVLVDMAAMNFNQMIIPPPRRGYPPFIIWSSAAAAKLPLGARACGGETSQTIDSLRYCRRPWIGNRNRRTAWHD